MFSWSSLLIFLAPLTNRKQCEILSVYESYLPDIKTALRREGELWRARTCSRCRGLNRRVWWRWDSITAFGRPWNVAISRELEMHTVSVDKKCSPKETCGSAGCFNETHKATTVQSSSELPLIPEACSLSWKIRQWCVSLTLVKRVIVLRSSFWAEWDCSYCFSW